MLVLKRLTARFFATTSGNEPVREWLKGLPKDDRRSIGKDIEYVEYRWPIGRPLVAHLRGHVWEVRSSLNQRTARMLFAVDGETMILLHAFIKKSQTTPPADIALAEQRLKEYRHGKA